MNDDLKLLGWISREIEERHTNIAESYSDWLLCGFVCAQFGESGRSAYHSISSQSTKYRQSDTDKQFDNCVKSGRIHLGISPLFSLCKREGLVFTSIYPRREGGEKKKSVVNECCTIQLPLQNDNRDKEKKEDFISLLNKWACLSELVSITTDDFLLYPVVVSFLVGASAIVPNLSFVYGARKNKCHLYYCLIAPPASGKSVINDVRKCFSKWHNVLRDESNRAWANYKEERKNAPKEQKEDIPQPPLRTLFLPADTSTSALLATIRDMNGGGLMWESELDTLTRNFKSEHGNFSDILRNNFHSEPITSNRKKDREFIEIETPHMSFIVTGTPAQLSRFFGDGENGLFSRFLFGFLPASLTWVDQWTAENNEEIINSVGDYVLQLANRAQSHVCSVVFSSEQKKEHTRFFTQLQEDYYALYGGLAISQVRRAALIHLRLASILEYMMSMEQQNGGGDIIECSSNSWTLAKMIIEDALCNAVVTSSLLPSSDEKKTAKQKEQEEILASLPASFTLVDLPSTLSQATKYRWVKAWTDKGIIQKENGYYRKK